MPKFALSFYYQVTIFAQKSENILLKEYLTYLVFFLPLMFLKSSYRINFKSFGRKGFIGAKEMQAELSFSFFFVTSWTRNLILKD